MKKKYIAPKIEIIEMDECTLLSSSLKWKPSDGSGDFDVKDEDDDLGDEITGAKDNVIWDDEF